MKRPKIWVLGPMGWIGSIRCEKFWRDFVARTFAPVLPVLHRVRQPNSPKCSQIEQNTNNKSLESNSEDWVRSLRKIHTRLGSSNFCTCRPVLHRVFVIQPNGPKCTKLVWNAPEHEFRVQWGGSGAFVTKNSYSTSWHELLHQFDPFCTEYWKATKQSQMHPNSTKSTKRRV